MVQKTSVEDLLEISSDVMQYIVIKEMVVETVRMKWGHTKRKKLEN